MNNGVTAAGNLLNSFVILTSNGCVKLKFVIATKTQSQNHLIDLPLQGVNSLFVLSIENLTNKLKWNQELWINLTLAIIT